MNEEHLLDDCIRQIEDYARQCMDGHGGDLGIAHDYKHADRVRSWALRIAQEEGYPNQELVKATALLHDIGLAVVEDRALHAQTGAGMAADFLKTRQFFSESQIAEIAHAIRSHSSLSGGGALGEILRDADMLDMFGPVGLMRAFTSQHHKPEYDPGRPKGETWGLGADDFTGRFADGIGAGPTIVDQINFQISCYANLTTETARRLALPLVAYMQAYLIELERQIGAV
jgi:HD superfamily phosphodiesterase